MQNVHRKKIKLTEPRDYGRTLSKTDKFRYSHPIYNEKSTSLLSEKVVKPNVRNKTLTLTQKSYPAGYFMNRKDFKYVIANELETVSESMFAGCVI